jgi:hypothetical protein
MNCTRDRWLDVFVTKPDSQFGEQYQFDDQFLCTVQSVALSSDTKKASIVDASTNFLLPTWSGPYSISGAQSIGGFGDHPLRSVEAGDIVRIGNPMTGHTDYLTVVEVIHVERIYNLLGEDYRTSTTSGGSTTYTEGTLQLAPYDFWKDIPTSKGKLRQQIPQDQAYWGIITSGAVGVGDATTNVFTPEAGTQTHISGLGHTGASEGYYYDPGTAGIAHIVLRVNVQLNATKLPPIYHGGDTGAALGAMTKFTTKSAAMADRASVMLPLTNPLGHNGIKIDASGSVQTVSAEDSSIVLVPMKDEAYPHPLYLNKKWSHGTTLYANLDHGVKSLACVKLTGYSIVNKRQVGVNHQHELMNDDYFIMHINEIEGKVVSNNKYANGAFAILHTPVGNQTEGAIEHSQFDPAGIVTHYFDNCDSTIRNLTIKVTDRRGQPAHIGRLHLWFKLLVIHG